MIIRNTSSGSGNNEIATETKNPNPVRKVHFSAPHNVEIAEVISRSKSIQELTNRLVELFSEDNSRFDEILFRREACRKH